VPHDPRQAAEHHRVRERIAEAVREFVFARPIGAEFTGPDLDAHVIAQAGATPGSAARILRDLRDRHVLNYECVKRSESRYRRTAVEPHASPRLLDYAQRVAAGMAQSDACGGGRGHVRLGEAREAIETRAKIDARLRDSLRAAGGSRAVLVEMFARYDWAEVEPGVWTPVEAAEGAA